MSLSQVAIKHLLEGTMTSVAQKSLPRVNGDFYHINATLSEEDQALLLRVRAFMETEVAPIINQYWTREEFPHQLVPGLAALGAAGLPYQGYGCPGKSSLLDGMLAMEMARVEKIGAFGLTEPDVGSGTAGGLTTTARREGDTWVLNGQKKWIGNATFADYVIIWAREEGSNQVKGFVVGKDNPGFSVEKIKTKMALRVVQNGLITLSDCRVPESDRLQNADTFKDTAKVLRMTRTGVAWFAVGCQMGAYEHALRYATERIQFGRPIGGFQLVQDLLVRMLGNVTSTQAMMLRLAQLQDEGLMQDEHASLAKAFCTVKCRETVGYARELLGGNGILLENHIGRFVADAEAIYSYEGTREMNTLIVGKSITGLSAFV